MRCPYPDGDRGHGPRAVAQVEPVAVDAGNHRLKCLLTWKRILITDAPALQGGPLCTEARVLF